MVTNSSTLPKPVLKDTKTMKQFSITKRDGRKEPYDINKIHKVCFYGCEGIDGVSVSELEMELAPLLRDGMTTVELNDQVISACKSLIAQGKFHYDKVGGRITAFIVRKEAYGKFKPPKLYDIIVRNVAIGRYTTDLLTMYTEEEWHRIDAMIDHDRDDLFRLGGAEQMRVKYLSKNRVTKKICESFQIPFILVSAVMNNWISDKELRLQELQLSYDIFSTFDASEPTPIMSGVRTITKQFSSCVLIDSGDSLPEINSASSAIVNYVSNKAGLGVNVGRNRGLGASVRGGEVIHTGLIPFIKKLTMDTKCCSQGGVRDGAVTFFYPMWHYEFPELINLKSNSLPEEQVNTRADYGVQINKFLYTRLLQDGKISLFSPHEVPGLYEAFFSDQDEFSRLYQQYEKDPKIRKRTFMASELFNMLATQRSNSGRIYIMNVDIVNERSSFKRPIYQSNLCMEITLPSAPMQDVNKDDTGDISLCTLAAVNWGKINKPSDFERVCRKLVRDTDYLLDYQDYPVAAAKKSTLHYRPLGIGIIGFAHFLAKKNLPYNRAALPIVDEYAEAWSYYLLRASVDLAMEKGPCPGWKETKYADGWTPNMTRSKLVDQLVPNVERLDWAGLRADMVKYGIRNSTLMALMPSETSSQLSNETNGIEPARGMVVVKTSKDASPPLVVPEVDELKYWYDWLWDQRSPRGYLEVTAVLCKWIDQAASINTSYNPAHAQDGKISVEMLLQDILYAYQLGHKNLYYNTTKKPGETDILTFDDDDSGCESGACAI